MQFMHSLMLRVSVEIGRSVHVRGFCHVLKRDSIAPCRLE
jgi:hypothetical protein